MLSRISTLRIRMPAQPSNHAPVAALILCLAASTLSAADGSFELPKESITLKKSAGVEQVQSSCLICHSTDYISTQPLLTKAQWTATVDKMRVRYGAPIPTNNVPALVDYLTRSYGKATPTK